MNANTINRNSNLNAPISLPDVDTEADIATETDAPPKPKMKRAPTPSELRLVQDRQKAKRDLEARFGKARPAEVFRLVSYRRKGMSDEEAFRALRRKPGATTSTRKRAPRDIERRLREASDTFIRTVLEIVA